MNIIVNAFGVSPDVASRYQAQIGAVMQDHARREGQTATQFAYQPMGQNNERTEEAQRHRAVIEKMLREGASLEAIQKHVPYTRGHLLRVTAGMRAKLRETAEFDESEVFRLRAQGLSMAKIGSQLNLAPSTVHRVLSEKV